ncbi:MAG: hypothetical protein ACLFUX_06395 [Spirochaetaceae bacterium]
MSLSRSAARYHNLMPALAAVFVVLLAGCEVREDITISVDGSGTAETEIGLDRVFLRYLRDLSGSMGGAEDDLRIFDLEEIERRLAEREGLEVERIERGGPGELALSVRFSDVGTLLAEEDTRFIRLERPDDGDRRRLVMLAGRETAEEALTYSPAADSTAVRSLLPPGGMGADEYTEYLVWALEEYEEPDTLGDKIGSAAIEVVVVVDGEILSQSGGERRGDTVRFELPLVELLTADRPERYSVEFR